MIFYFTGTGNSLYAAKKLISAEGERLVNMAKAIKYNEYTFSISKDEKVIFVFPVYFYGVPTLVVEFVEKLTIKFNGELKLYTVITCGGKIAGADKMFEKLIGKRNYKVINTYKADMPNNYLMLFEAGKESELAESDKQLEVIKNSIYKNEGEAYHSSIIGKLTTAFSYTLYKHGRKTSKFYAEDTCVNCGLCEKICPCNVIKIMDGKPQWIEKRCTQCLGCLNRCPVNAIQYGKSTKRRGRYVNPIL